jgi:cyanophycin synthetase
LDYAHNPAGLRALHEMIKKMNGAPKVGMIAGIGDRRPEDNREVGAVAAEMFDEIIIRQDKHLRGKTEEELIEMIHDGIKSVDPNKPVTIIPSEEEAITHAITNAKKGSLLVFCTDVVPDALNLVMSFKEKESKEILEN